MSKKFYRYFFGFLDTQEKWLNNMAQEGYRLVRTTKMTYEFEQCPKGEYQYCVEFVGEKSYKKAKEYRQFLEEMGYRTFTKNIKLNYSFGKIKWRPWARGMGQISTSPGSYNKELLILEKKNDGKPFKLHTDCNDLIQYYRPIRNAYLYVVLFATLLFVLSFTPSVMSQPLSGIGKVLVGVVGILFMIPTISYSKRINACKEEQKIHN